MCFLQLVLSNSQLEEGCTFYGRFGKKCVGKISLGLALKCFWTSVQPHLLDGKKIYKILYFFVVLNSVKKIYRTLFYSIKLVHVIEH